ncbi:hypothetical protein SPRG_16208 [Saprolegnia parasitica CBS 223.65]|uniref:Uncharacterized protein n=1 Tax=Saprolegnia parasitica (strain CBS 223.65) TaxID=695850 RepID=A0A067BNK3_SAPPC|nr:hypothetical protein SPRG_16208 [Saprolegnia parasitica CBS 223.65]KDO18325.1 hypothetical protein SPRG_16208 [Saprolegnia parasitica CBS 223.65]|eukprot:XP_012210965.1 hypothetical protein SPRG_16208 [Saprolegnia parasitica CBS 223.65]
MGLHISVMLAVSAMTLATNDVAHVNAAPSNTTSGIEAVVQDLPYNQWSILREPAPDGIYVNARSKPIKPQWLQICGSTVKLADYDACGGGVWQVYQSTESNKVDQLRHVASDHCLDAYWSDKDQRPLVHGYPCNMQNGNQHWVFDLGETKLGHRRYQDWILVADNDYIEMVHRNSLTASTPGAYFVFIK